LYLCSIQKRKRFGGGALISSLVTKRFLFLYGIYFVYTVLFLFDWQVFRVTICRFLLQIHVFEQ